MIKKILYSIPIKIANSLVAHFILKSKLKLKAQYYKNVELRYTRTIKMDLNSTDIGHQYLAFTGVYENDLTEKLLSIKAKQSGLMVDVGANYGYYSLLWVANNPKNRTISFEASPKNANFLQKNILKNNLDHQITYHKEAVSDQNGKIYFDLGPKDQTGWGGISLNDNGEHIIEVETITLDNYFKDNKDIIEVLKIDTEGADYLVIKGCTDLLRAKRIKHIFWEENIFRAQKLGLNGMDAQKLLEKKRLYHFKNK